MPETRQNADIKNVISDVVRSTMADDLFINTLIDKVTDLFEKRLLDMFKKYETEISSLKTSVTRLEMANDALEQNSRCDSVRIYGLPEMPGENTVEVVMNTIKTHLRVDIQVDHVDRAYRLPKGKKEKYRPILVKFSSYKWKKLVFDAKKNFKGTNYVIREDLTKSRVHLMYYTKQAFDKSPVWTLDGNIFVKLNNTRHKILSIDDVERLKV